jgi:hypothetical protein
VGVFRLQSRDLYDVGAPDLAFDAREFDSIHFITYESTHQSSYTDSPEHPHHPRTSSCISRFSCSGVRNSLALQV